MERFDDTTWSLSVEIIGLIAQLDQLLDEGPRTEVEGEPHVAISEADLTDIRDAVYGGLIRSLGDDGPEKLQREYDRRSEEGTLEVDQSGASE